MFLSTSTQTRALISEFSIVTKENATQNWTIYDIAFIDEETLKEFYGIALAKGRKVFVQSETLSEDFSDGSINGGLYNNLFGKMPLPWVRFFLQNEMEILAISKDLEFMTRKNGRLITPGPEKVFRQFDLIKPSEVRVIIVGQDPYPIEGMADGVAFSTFQTTVPRSLANIYKELAYEKIPHCRHPNLDHLVRQGCFLINASWTTVVGTTRSHSTMWQGFTTSLISFVLDSNPDRKLILTAFGKDAAKLCAKFAGRAAVFETAHPAPNSFSKFYKCGIFSKINTLLDPQLNFLVNKNVQGSSAING